MLKQARLHLHPESEQAGPPGLDGGSGLARWGGSASLPSERPQQQSRTASGEFTSSAVRAQAGARRPANKQLSELSSVPASQTRRAAWFGYLVSSVGGQGSGPLESSGRLLARRE